VFKKPRKPIGIYLVPDLIDSKAFRKLNGTALKVLIYFYRKRQLVRVGRKGKEIWTVKNNGEIVFPYTEAEKKYGLTKRRFRDALDNLIELGFIDIAHHGGGMMGDCTLYAISGRWRKYGTGQFIYKTRPKDTRGLGFTPENWEDMTGKKKLSALKVGNDSDTCPSNKSVTGKPIKGKGSSVKNVTEQTTNIPLILKAIHQYFQIMNRSNKNVTVL